MALKFGVKATVFSPTQKGPCENLNITGQVKSTVILFPKILKDTFVRMLGLSTLSTLSEDSRQRNVLITPTNELVPADRQD